MGSGLGCCSEETNSSHHEEMTLELVSPKGPPRSFKPKSANDLKSAVADAVTGAVKKVAEQLVRRPASALEDGTDDGLTLLRVVAPYAHIPDPETPATPRTPRLLKKKHATGITMKLKTLLRVVAPYAHIPDPETPATPRTPRPNSARDRYQKSMSMRSPLVDEGEERKAATGFEGRSNNRPRGTSSPSQLPVAGSPGSARARHGYPPWPQGEYRLHLAARWARVVRSGPNCQGCSCMGSGLGCCSEETNSSHHEEMTLVRQLAWAAPSNEVKDAKGKEVITPRSPSAADIPAGMHTRLGTIAIAEPLDATTEVGGRTAVSIIPAATRRSDDVLHGIEASRVTPRRFSLPSQRAVSRQKISNNIPGSNCQTPLEPQPVLHSLHVPHHVAPRRPKVKPTNGNADLKLELAGLRRARAASSGFSVGSE
eukprot:symbB.v1.2.016976.t1/scaffold1272.1/size127520/8